MSMRLRKKRSQFIIDPVFMLGERLFVKRAFSHYCNCKAALFYAFFRVKKIPTIAPIRTIGANLTNSHSNA